MITKQNSGGYFTEGDVKDHYRQPFEDDLSVDKETAILNEMLGCFDNTAVAGLQEEHLHTLNENEIFLSPSSTKPVEEDECSQWINLPENNTHSLPTSMLLPQEVEYFKLASYSPSMNVFGTGADHITTVFEQVQTEFPLDETPSLTVSQQQLFTIHEISPEWGYAHEATKVIVIGSFLCGPDRALTCMFGEIEVPIQIIQDGVIRCHAPPSFPGKVTLCLTSSNRESCSEVREFEYRDYPSKSPYSNLLEAEASKNSEELLLLVRFVQMLLFDPLISQRKTSEMGIDLLGKVKAGEDSWAQVIETLLAGNWTSSSITDWLLQEFLKDKLQQWLSSRLQVQEVTSLQGCSLSKKDQGIIHMVAGMEYEWALKPILNSGVNVDFRDINGLTALHWAARFGREKMVAALIASGASAEAVTDPTKHDPTGKTPASIAAAYGHKGLAGYLSEVSLTSHLSSLTLAESELSKYSANLEAEKTISSIYNIGLTSEDQQSLKDILAAVRNTTQAAARIQAAFRAHSFKKRKQEEAAALTTDVDSKDQYSSLSNDAQSLSAASKLLFRNSRDYNAAALSIQKKYRGWKGHRDFLAFRQKVVKIQAHVRGHQVRKYYKVICWAVGILEKVVLRWRRGGVGLRGFRHESESVDENEDKDEDIVKVFRKQKVAAIDEAVSRVLSMVTSLEARQQYSRMIDIIRQAKAELGGPTSEATSTSLDLSNMEKDGID